MPSIRHGAVLDTTYFGPAVYPRGRSSILGSLRIIARGEQLVRCNEEKGKGIYRYVVDAPMVQGKVSVGQQVSKAYDFPCLGQIGRNIRELISQLAYGLA